MHFAPICLFVFKRLSYTKLTVDSLRKNPEAENSELFIYSDGPRPGKDETQVREVRDYIKAITGFKSVKIFESEKNQGLANSIIKGVTQVVNDYGRCIVLEDDMIVSPYFLKYMNEALELYENEEDVISIHGYIYPVKEKLPETFFLRGADCWGWATWKRGWDLFEEDSKKLLKEIRVRKLEYEFDIKNSFNNVRMLENQITGKVDSWAIRWHASAFLKNKYTLYPGSSLVKNIGMGEEATHTTGYNYYDVEPATKPINLVKLAIEKNEDALDAVSRFFKNRKYQFIKKLLKKLRTS